MSKYHGFWLESAAVLFIWAVLIGWLTASGSYEKFLRPELWVLMLWALLILVLFSWAMLRQMSPSIKERQEFPTYVKLGTLIVPLFFILMAQQQSLGSYAFEKKGGPGSFSDMKSALKGPALPPNDGNVSILQIIDNLDDWKGERITTEGMVYRSEDLPDQTFVLYRFLMVCCAADAVPLGLFIETDNAGTFEPDTWVSVRGLLSIQAMGGVDSPYIKAEQISLADAPVNKYLYPRYYW
jgi:putative membrane protein